MGCTFKSKSIENREACVNKKQILYFTCEIGGAQEHTSRKPQFLTELMQSTRVVKEKANVLHHTSARYEIHTHPRDDAKGRAHLLSLINQI